MLPKPSLRAPAIPSGRPSVAVRRPVHLIALLAVRDGMRFLPGYVANVGPQVDGIVALDDGSSDGCADFLAERPEVLELIRVPASRPTWDQMGNHRKLVSAALRHGAEWLISIDADERLEREFRARAERVIRRGRLLDLGAFAVRFRELWDAPDQFRVDGIWGRKSQARLYRARADHVFDTAALHGIKAPLQYRSRDGSYPLADLNLYHLGMLTPETRAARRHRLELADPEARWQRVGYAYLTDEAGLRVRSIRPRRMYEE